MIIESWIGWSFAEAVNNDRNIALSKYPAGTPAASAQKLQAKLINAGNGMANRLEDMSSGAVTAMPIGSILIRKAIDAYRTWTPDATILSPAAENVFWDRSIEFAMVLDQFNEMDIAHLLQQESAASTDVVIAQAAETIQKFTKDTVNTAANLPSLIKKYGTLLLIGVGAVILISAYQKASK